MRAHSIAEKLLCNNAIGFWNEVRALNRTNTLLPSVIEGVSGDDNIVGLWRQHYSTLFNCVKSEPYTMGSIANRDTVIITPNEVQQAIAQLSDNKAKGSDNIAAEHLKYASQKVAVLLSIRVVHLWSLPDTIHITIH